MRAEPGPEDVWAKAALAQPAGTADTSWELQPEEQVEGRRWSKGSHSGLRLSHPLGDGVEVVREQEGRLLQVWGYWCLLSIRSPPTHSWKPLLPKPPPLKVTSSASWTHSRPRLAWPSLEMTPRPPSPVSAQGQTHKGIRGVGFRQRWPPPLHPARRPRSSSVQKTLPKVNQSSFGSKRFPDVLLWTYREIFVLYIIV